MPTQLLPKKSIQTGAPVAKQVKAAYYIWEATAVCNLTVRQTFDVEF